jgi:hypothetical protein
MSSYPAHPAAAPRPAQGIGTTLASTPVPPFGVARDYDGSGVQAAGMTWQGGVSGTSGAKYHIRPRLSAAHCSIWEMRITDQAIPNRISVIAIAITAHLAYSLWPTKRV